MKSPTTTTPSLTFPHRLWDILSDPSNDSIISWDSDGRSFSIHDIKNFQSQLLPMYFRHSRLPSFVRQLNMYDFHKLRSQKPGQYCFQNVNFSKWNEMSRLVGRKMPSRREVGMAGKGSRTVVEEDGESLGSGGAGVEQVVSGNFQMEKIRSKGQSQANSSSHPNPQSTTRSTQHLIQNLIEQIKSKDLVLDCDIQSAVEALLKTQPYREMDERHLPLILEQLGVEECGERKRKMSFRTEELLAVDPEQPSMKLII